MNAERRRSNTEECSELSTVLIRPFICAHLRLRLHVFPPHSSPDARRFCFFFECRFLSASRRRFDPFVGFVAFRGVGSTSDSRIIAASFSRQSSRLRSWSRYFCDWITTSPSTVKRLGNRARIRARAVSGIAAEVAAAFQRNTAFDATLFTFCPPGPPARA